MMIRKLIPAGAVVALLLGGGAYAQTGAYTWTGMGTNVAGSSKCSTYKMTIGVTVDGKALKGTFQQQGRAERSFAATLNDKGLFKTKAQLDAGSSMDVSGTISDKENRVLLDGYCKFEGKLTKK